MIKLAMTAGTTTDITVIPITKVFNTNDNLSLSDNVVKVLQPGIYEVAGSATITSTATSSTGIAVWANGSQVDTSAVWTAEAVGETQTVPIYALLNVVRTTDAGNVLVQFVPTGNPTIVSGTIGIKLIS